VVELDELDRLAVKAFDGYLVRKDLAQRFKGQYPVPTYVGEFLLGRYCASTDEEEIAEGLEVVERHSLLKKALVELISRRGCAISCTCASLDIPANKLRESYVTRVPCSLITQSIFQMTNTNCCTPRR